ncbi:MAG: Mu transposase C-terminal domain-containing protein, partial [Atribacterota bacterium]|nr:Mu transposase C-terminal domain-containing protein [Atribacterota bacterium]
MIHNNQVYQYTGDKNKNKIRIIDIDNYDVYVVSLNKNTSMPIAISISDFEEELLSENLMAVSEPYTKIIYDEDLSPTLIHKRNKNWEIVFNNWNMFKKELLKKNSREGIFKRVSEDEKITVIKLKRLFTRFWQRGQNRNSLLPDYIYSGGKGKERQLTTEKKVGRPRKYNSEEQGINITEEVKKQFNFVIKKYYQKKENYSLRDSYIFLLREFYSDKYYENEVLKYKIWESNKIPTYPQFYYWYKKLEDPEMNFRTRVSDKKYELTHRMILNNSTMETDGPGYRFQVDATIADVYLVNSFDRNIIIGRPVIYAINDVYSRLFTGIYVGLEGPSWVGAMMALDNMISDKVEFCAKHGIIIDESQWPAKHLPDVIIADRGEFEGYSVENLINNLNIRIENTAPYRGDLKGIVERQFRTINEKIKRKAPGAIQKEFRERGDRDYRLDATLSLEEFIKIIINLVLAHNQKIIEKYPLEKQMVLDRFIATPLNLWNWGIENKKGRLKVVQDRNIMRLNILPRGKARITRAGLKFKKLHYSSGKAITEQWYLKNKNKSIDIVYDPRDIN